MYLRDEQSGDIQQTKVVIRLKGKKMRLWALDKNLVLQKSQNIGN